MTEPEAVEPVDVEIVDAEIVENADELVAADVPVPLVRLRAALYEDNGALILAFRTDEMTRDGHFTIAPVMVKMLGKVAGVKGDPLEVLRAFAGGAGAP